MHSPPLLSPSQCSYKCGICVTVYIYKHHTHINTGTRVFCTVLCVQGTGKAVMQGLQECVGSLVHCTCSLGSSLDIHVYIHVHGLHMYIVQWKYM